MVLIDRSNLSDIYAEIRKQSLGLGNSVVVFVSPEGDSLCACKILTRLFQTDLIPYMIKPVSGYEDLARINEEWLKDNEEIKSIIMINCGGIVDLEEFLNIQEGVSIYVIDSHRPYNLSNVRDENTSVHILECLDDDEVREDYPSEVEWSSDDSSDSESDFDDDGTRAKRRRTDEDDGQRKIKKEKQRRMEEYYKGGSYYGTSAAMVTYDIALQLSKDENAFLWCAILGLSDQIIHERISPMKYNLKTDYFQDEVERLNVQDDKNIYDDDGSTITSLSSHVEEDNLVKMPTSGTIGYGDEYRFMLLQHWSLYGSMYHSPYVASRLGIWNDRGKNQLATLLAKMGLPLSECKRCYRHMENKYKSKLKAEIDRFAPNYGLNEVTYFTFFRQQGRKLKISAIDMMYSMTALLEETKWTSDETEGAEDDMIQFDPKEVIEDQQVSDNEDEGDEYDAKKWERNFWKAYDCLGGDNMTLIKRGLRHSIRLQKAIVRTGVHLMTKKLIVQTGPFRYACLEDAPDLPFFLRPLALSKLALFIIDSLIDTYKRKRKPFVICASNKKRLTYLVVGVTGDEMRSGAKNWFGHAFRDAADGTQARIKHDSFETAVMEVQQDDIQKFLELLHSGLVVM